MHKFQVEGDPKGDREVTILAADSHHAQLNKPSERDLKVWCQYLLSSVRSYIQRTVSRASQGLN